ncbi:hypothetical protein [Yeosuana sp. AK3]
MFTTLAQQKDSVSFKNGIDKPSILALHHFGIFSSRIHQNFKLSPNINTSVSFSHTSGNVFHPFLETYIPKDPTVQKEQSQLIWYFRNFNFINQETTPADYMNIIVDAVIKEFRFNINIPINNKNEIDISIRSHLISKGKNPFSVFTGDQPIEWFHSNIAGGEDPYGRRFYGLNQVNFKYTDRNGNVLELHENDFIISGIETNYFYYPTRLNNKFKHLYFNVGTHFGINTSKFNPSLDFGISLNSIKKYIFKNNNEFHVGVGSSLLRKNVLKFDDVIDLGNNPYLASLESELEYTHYTKKKNYHSFGVNYQIQSRFNKLKESNYYRLIGNWAEINGGWQHGFSTLYKALSYWTFIYTYGRPEYKLSLYFKEDFRVNNAPDVQTGISLSFPILK